MNIQCPGCNAQIAFNPDNIKQSGQRIICDSCKAPFLIRQKTAAGQQTEEARDKILVANTNPHFCSAIKDFLAGRGFEVIIAKDGIETLQFLEVKLPHIALVDVALPGMYGFEICDFVKNNEKLKHIKVILLASIYDKTRYKRMPSSIYGADDYIEMHHIPDQLVPKINKLLGRDGGTGDRFKICPPNWGRGTDLERIELRTKSVPPIAKSVPSQAEGGKGAAHEEAKRLARIIMSDIILYNQEAVESGLRDGNLLELLKDDIREGQAYYAKRVPAEVRKNTAYLKNAFEELIGKMKKEMGV